MTSEEDVKLFRCKDRRQVYPGLHGLSLTIQDQLPMDDAYCVFGGPTCTYDGMIEFLFQKQDYQFIVGGLMFALPHRISKYARPSSPFTEYKIAIVGRRDSSSPIAQAYSKILRPFQLGTWVILLSVALFFICVGVIIAVHFAQPRNLRNIGSHLAGDFDTYPIAEDRRILNRLALRALTLAVTAFFAIVILFYEVPVANFLFLGTSPRLKKGLDKLGPEQLKQYVIIRGGGTEAIWRKFADPAKKYENVTPPWHFCTGDDDWYVFLTLWW